MWGLAVYSHISLRRGQFLPYHLLRIGTRFTPVHLQYDLALWALALFFCNLQVSLPLAAPDTVALPQKWQRRLRICSREMGRQTSSWQGSLRTPLASLGWGGSHFSSLLSHYLSHFYHQLSKLINIFIWQFSVFSPLLLRELFRTTLSETEVLFKNLNLSVEAPIFARVKHTIWNVQEMTAYFKCKQAFPVNTVCTHVFRRHAVSKVSPGFWDLCHTVGGIGW